MSSSAGLESKSADRVSYKLKYKLLKRCIKEIVLVRYHHHVFLYILIMCLTNPSIIS